MNAIIIGAAGFLGKVLSAQLQAAGWNVCGYDAVAPRGEPPCRDFHVTDVLAAPLAIPPGTDAVYYLAQSPHYREFPAEAGHLFGVNTYAAIRAAEAAAAAGVRLFCYTSTGNVYRPDVQPRSERDPVRRDDPYALSKLMAEESLRLFAKPAANGVPGMAVVAVRIFGLFGRGQDKMLPAVLLKKVQAGETITLEPLPGETDGAEGLVISFTLVDDAAQGLVQLGRAALAGESLPPVVNLASNEPVSLRRFATVLGELLGRTPEFARGERLRQWNLIADVRLWESLQLATFTPFQEAMVQSYAGAAGVHAVK
jgi:UDP-glucose 4-epimerase